MKQENCSKCGKPISANGRKMHEKFCKGTENHPPAEAERLEGSDISEQPDIKNQIDCTDANDVSVSVSKDASGETEQSSESKHSDSYYINYLIIIILAIVGAIIFFIKTGTLKMENQK